nr:MAG TPA: RNA polymerase subunit [Caudoviricetes sp.]
MDNLAVVNSPEQMLTMENLRNANALLALLHGKSDSVCRLFDKEIIVDINQLDNLNSLVLEKLGLHSICCKRMISRKLSYMLQAQKISRQSVI